MPKSKRALKSIPKFQNEAEEADFWATADSTEYLDWTKARPLTFPNLRPSSTPISLRLPDTLLLDLKRLANERDVPYQSLMKVYLANSVAAERNNRRRFTKD